MTYLFLTPSREDVNSLQETEQRSLAPTEGSFLIPLSTEEPKLVCPTSWRMAIVGSQENTGDLVFAP
jgi:hypothetical protein